MNNQPHPKKIVFIVLSVLLLAIAAAEAQDNPPYRIDVPKSLATAGNKNLSSIAREIRYIPLEAKPGSYLKKVDLSLVCGDFILIYDETSDALKQFDLNGRYLGNFMKKGKGPGEFISIYSLDINDKGEILVFKEGYTVEIYSKSRQLINHFSTEVYANKARWLTDTSIAFIRTDASCILTDGYLIEIVDRSGNILSRCLKTDITKIPAGQTWMNRFNSIEEGCYYWSRLCDTVYLINKSGKLLPRVILVTDKNFADRNKISEGEERAMLTGESGYMIKGYFESEGSIYLNCIYKTTNSILVFDKKTGTCSNIMAGNDKMYKGYYNDLDKGPWFLPHFAFNDGWRGRILSPDELFRYLDYSFKEPGLIDPSSYDIEVYKQLAGYGNPVLMLAR
ncbi:MAG TPA: hypothetical protein DC042_15855 [Bacteroidales bacterium]|nr:hypothetical protein [Bacteroidales bacterium]